MGFTFRRAGFRANRAQVAISPVLAVFYAIPLCEGKTGLRIVSRGCNRPVRADTMVPPSLPCSCAPSSLAVKYNDLLTVLWDRVDPTTLNRQGNDSGTQYRSG